eukprot:SAG31_NODE_31_length_32474_cov_18.308139_12_plen_192_part_00
MHAGWGEVDPAERQDALERMERRKAYAEKHRLRKQKKKLSQTQSTNLNFMPRTTAIATQTGSMATASEESVPSDSTIEVAVEPLAQDYCGQSDDEPSMGLQTHQHDEPTVDRASIPCSIKSETGSDNDEREELRNQRQELLRIEAQRQGELNQKERAAVVMAYINQQHERSVERVRMAATKANAAFCKASD